MRKDQALATAIAHARDLGYDAIAEDCLNIADTPFLGEEVSESEDEKGVKRVTIKKVDMLGHRRLQVETRLKLLAKFNPKKYGDKVELSGDPDKPVAVDLYHTVFGKLLENMKMQRQQEQEE
jgi:hypothetical protein